MNVNVESIYKEVRRKLDPRGGANYTEYLQVVEDVIREKLDSGELNVDDDNKALREKLELMWNQDQDYSS